MSIAIGLVQAARDVDATDALAALRARAFTTECSVEDIADQLVGGTIDAVVLLP